MLLRTGQWVNAVWVVGNTFIAPDCQVVVTSVQVKSLAESDNGPYYEVLLRFVLKMNPGTSLLEIL
jgi:hypothetical protein